MNKSPLVSCIIIFFNAEAFIGDAIESIVRQSYDFWELLLVDDGSSDASAGIASEWVSRFPDRIRYLTHPDSLNHGMSATRNLGISEARGTLIAFLDADDVWLPNKLEEQVELLGKHPEAAMLYGRSLIWHSWAGGGKKHAQDHFEPLGVKPDTVVKPPLLACQMIDNIYQTPTTCSAIIRRDAVDRVGGFESQFRGLFEDQVFFIKIALLYPVYVSNKCWSRYRQHDESHSIALDQQFVRRQRINLLHWILNYVNELPGQHSVVRRKIQRTLIGYNIPYWHEMRSLVLRALSLAGGHRLNTRDL